MSDEAPVFVDTNVLVYAYDASEPDRRAVAQETLSELMRSNRLRLSTQVLQELYVTLTRKVADRLDPEISAAVDVAAGALGEAGAAVREISLPHTRYAISSYYLLATAEASSNLARYDAVRYGRRVDRGAGLQAMYRDSRGRGFGEEVQRRIMLGTFALSAGYQDANGAECSTSSRCFYSWPTQF